MWAKTSLFTRLTTTLNNTTTKNGMKETELLTTEFMLLTSHRIKLKTQIREFGPLISPKLDLDLEALLTFIIFQLVTSSSHPSAWIFQRENHSTLIMTTWLSVCQDSSMMALLNMKMVLQHQLLKWPMMFLTSLITCKEEQVIRDLIKWLECICSLPDLLSCTLSNTSKLKPITETYYAWDGKCTLLETDSIINTSKQAVLTQDHTNSVELCGHD